MRAAAVLRQAAAAQHRQPLIKFVGKRVAPQSVDHAPQAHPASPTHSLPDSFKTYRSKAQQHGPLNFQYRHDHAYGAIGGNSGNSLGPVEPKKGEYFDRSELPERFGRTAWTQAEIDAVETGGASMW